MTETLAERVEAAGQGHLLAQLDRLDKDGAARLGAQLGAVDWESVPELIERYVLGEPEHDGLDDLEPAPYYPNDPGSAQRPWDRATAHEAGEELIRAGKVAAFVVAGGQGTRLGFDGPKGCYPAGAVTGKPLFAFFADNLLGAHDRFGVRVPLYVMTSPLNHDATVAYFREQDHFGLDAGDVTFFQQGTMPSFDAQSGRILLSGPDRLATNPDGHGGSVRALSVSGALGDMRRRGVEHVSYFQVDNPIVNVLDPVFIGLHATSTDSSGEASSKMLAKAYPEEKVGVFCVSGGRVRVVEYSDLPLELQRERTETGELRFVAGSPAIHIFGVGFLGRLNDDPGFALPWHRAVKKVPYFDPDRGRSVEPDAPNGVKLERFVFDALPLAERSIVYETSRVVDFAPIKNAEGVDSAESSRRIQTERAAAWLNAAGVEIPRDGDGQPDCTIELSPRTASERAHLSAADLPERIERGAKIAL